jgi:hypothetical protein
MDTEIDVPDLFIKKILLKKGLDMFKKIRFLTISAFAVLSIGFIAGCSESPDEDKKVDKLNINIESRSASWYLDVKAQDPDYFKGYLICKWQPYGENVYLKVARDSNGTPIVTYGSANGAGCQWEFIPYGSNRMFIKCLSPDLDNSTYSYYLAGGIYWGESDDAYGSGYATVFKVNKEAEQQIFNGINPTLNTVTNINLIWDRQNPDFYGGEMYYNFHTSNPFVNTVCWTGYDTIIGSDMGYLNIQSLQTYPQSGGWYWWLSTTVQMGYVPYGQTWDTNYAGYWSNKWRIQWYSEE